MRHILTDELARMTAAALESFNDACDLYHFTVTTDSDTGEVGEAYDSTPSLGLACGFVEASEFRNERGQTITIDADAIVRLPLTQTIAVKDKIVARGKTYQVDGLTPGRNVRIVKLMEIKI